MLLTDTQRRSATSSCSRPSARSRTDVRHPAHREPVARLDHLRRAAAAGRSSTRSSMPRSRCRSSRSPTGATSSGGVLVVGHPVAVGVGPRLEPVDREAVHEELARSHPVEPALPRWRAPAWRVVAPSRSAGEPSSAQNVMRGQSRGNQNSGAWTSSIVHTIGGWSGLVAGRAARTARSPGPRCSARGARDRSGAGPPWAGQHARDLGRRTEDIGPPARCRRGSGSGRVAACRP